MSVLKIEAQIHIFQMDSNSERRWDDSILLKEETDASYMSKKEAVVKRERIKEYSFNHRVSPSFLFYMIMFLFLAIGSPKKLL